MQKKVGILLRENETYQLNKELARVLINFDVIPIGIVSSNLSHIIEISKICDGFILQGGNNYTEVEIEFVKYLYENNIPVLGICLGMQMMAIASEGELGVLNNTNHQSKEKYVHDIIVEENSKLYQIVNEKNISVNSRHNDYVKFTSLSGAALSTDNIIEAIEAQNKKFYIGVQWHPESIMNQYNKKLFQAFIDAL